MYLGLLVEISGAGAGAICTLGKDGEWLTLAHDPVGPEGVPHLRLFLESIEHARLSCAAQGFAIVPRERALVLATPLVLDAQGTPCLFLASLDARREPEALSIVYRLQTSSDLFTHHRLQRSAGDALIQKNQLAGILDLAASVQATDRFLQAAMTFVNEIASRHACQRTSLGWIEGGYARIKAVSHADQFERKMEVVRLLEDAMEEAWEQDSDLVWPVAAGVRTVVRAQETYARSQDSGHVATLLVRLGEEAVGAVCLERKAAGFDIQELQVLRAALDQVSRRLADLRDRDRWFGARWTDSARKVLARTLGFEHTWIKAGALAAAIASIFVFLVPVPYRVDAPTLLRTDQIHYVTAPFDGYLDSVGVKPGDIVLLGQEMILLDRKDLLLQEADLQAEAQTAQREIQKAQAIEDLGAIRIGAARLDQTEAKLAATRWKLEQSSLRCSFPRAVVVEGTLEQKRGAPVRQGEELLKVARIENIYAEIDVDEGELRNLAGARTGELALKSRPSETFSVAIERINPAAMVKDKENVFLVRARLDSVPDWFRPGMAGIAKIDAGRRTLWWIVSHRTLDFLRLKLWW
jgi:hypothetical protein